MKLSPVVVLTDKSWREFSSADAAIQRTLTAQENPPFDLPEDLQDLAAALTEANPVATWIIWRLPSGTFRIEVRV